MSTPADFKIIYNQIRWVERYLYERDCLSPSAIERMHLASTDTAPDFFRMVRGLLLDAAALEVAKLLDRATQNGQTNISLEAVVRDADWLDQEQKEKAREALDRVRSKYPEIRHTRHKLLAHADYKCVRGLSDPATHGDFINVDQLNNAVFEMRRLVDSIRPNDVPLARIPRDHHEWLGVSVLLERLSQP